MMVPGIVTALLIALLAGSTFYVLGMADLLQNTLVDLGVVLIAVLVYVSAVFAISQYVRRLDIVDIAWGGAFIVAAVVSFVIHWDDNFGAIVPTLVTAMVGIWGVRLAVHILQRLIKSPEDARYVELRKQWRGNVAVNAYLRIFLTQGLLAFAIAVPVIHSNLMGAGVEFSWVVALGLVIWIVGFYFEAVGDAQLKSHLANPDNKGKLMTSGLWKYTRHPNYFGEATQWWGIGLICLATPYGWIGLVGPLLITYLLLYVSGVPLTEKRFEGRKGWDEYKARTSMFIPGPPKTS